MAVESDACAFCEGEMAASLISNVGGVALCEWCQMLPEDVTHDYPDIAFTFTEDGAAWECPCGSIYEASDWIDAAVLAAVPSVPAAMARWHLSGEPMPDLPSERLPSSEVCTCPPAASCTVHQAAHTNRG